VPWSWGLLGVRSPPRICHLHSFSDTLYPGHRNPRYTPKLSLYPAELRGASQGSALKILCPKLGPSKLRRVPTEDFLPARHAACARADQRESLRLWHDDVQPRPLIRY
jgi:hypothetical protein